MCTFVRSTQCFLLVCCMLWQGCVARMAMTEIPLPGKPIHDEEFVVITLKSGVEINCSSDRFVVVPRPSNLVIGLLIDTVNQERRTAIRCVDLAMIDSGGVEGTSQLWSPGLVFTQGRMAACAKYPLRNGGAVYFEEGKHVLVTTADGTGIWFAGSAGDFIASDSVRNIPMKEVVSVDYLHSDKTLTSLLVVGILVGVLSYVIYTSPLNPSNIRKQSR